MSFRSKLNRLKPHIRSEKTDDIKTSLQGEQLGGVVPHQEQWERNFVSPYYYDGDFCLIREKEYPLEQKYGKYTFSQFLDAVRAWNHSSVEHPLSSKGYDHEQLFFFDTETTGLGGGTGNTIFLLGYASVKNDKVVLRQHFLPHPAAEVPLYQSFLENIDYRTLVTYNGKAFDWPQVKTRHTLIRELVPKLPSFGHFDLFHGARRLWKHKLDRLKLSIVEKEVLGIEREEDVPGYLAPMIYFDFVETGKPDGMLGVLQHNEMDILSLITLYTHITFQLLNIDQSRTVSEGYEVGRWYASLGESTGALENLSLVANGTEESALKAKLALSLERKKLKEWDSAVVLWRELADGNNKSMAFEACIELAKYYEHRQKNLQDALSYSEKALHILQEKMAIWRGKDSTTFAEVEKRIERITKKTTTKKKPLIP
ncbi:ribonuclease H-like domain-containing protein [Robertmurraya massiliosenegalensis]|uniref:ribonuclease H-like domain-containing protein n=1 Tax=Robertmurraya TaxID=2837507 RepID=UPI0039A6DCA0